MLVEKPPKKEATETFWHINPKEKQVQRPRTGNTENVVDENQSDPCANCWCTWYSKEGDDRKHQESIRESYNYNYNNNNNNNNNNYYYYYY